MKLKHLKRFLDGFDNEEDEVFIKLKSHYDLNNRLPFSEGKIDNLNEQFRNDHLDFNSINFVFVKEYSLATEE